MSYEIRPAVPADAAAVSSLIQRSFQTLVAANWSPISLKFEVKGARATRMACWLPARQLGAEMRPAGR
jgi:hypothetical protein